MKPLPRLGRAALPVLLAGCASGPVPPDWQVNAHGALRGFSIAYLEGNTRVAEVEFARARSDLARTGRPDLVARAELTRCAVRAASLEFDDCPEFKTLAGDAGEVERAYANLIVGQWQGLDPKLLPPQYRGLPGTPGEMRNLNEIADPVSRLIAAGVLFRVGRLPPEGIVAAAETASANGWRRPLLAWLGVQRLRAADAGDKEAAERAQRRIDLITERRSPRP